MLKFPATAAVLAVMFAAVFSAHADIPERVKDVTQNIFLICVDIALKGKFYTEMGDESTLKNEERFVICSSATQISENKVLTSNHNLGSVKEVIGVKYRHKIAVYETHGFTPGLEPKQIDSVFVSWRLVSSEGIVYESDTQVYGVTWKAGVPTEKKIKAFLSSFVPAGMKKTATTRKMTVVKRSARSDLALISFYPGIVRSRYATPSRVDMPVGTKVWGVSATSHTRFSEEKKPVVRIVKGVLYDKSGMPAVGSAVVVPIWVLKTSTPSRGGDSGGFNVDSSGNLIGITYSTSFWEMVWGFDLPHPCNDKFPCRRSVISSTAIRTFLEEVQQGK